MEFLKIILKVNHPRLVMAFNVAMINIVFQNDL